MSKPIYLVTTLFLKPIKYYLTEFKEYSKILLTQVLVCVFIILLI